jgi:hypothetical protein
MSLFIISKYLLSDDDLKINRSVRNVDDCDRLQSDIDSVRNWCLNNGTNLNSGKITIIFFPLKTISFNFNNPIISSQCVEDTTLLLDCKICFHHHTDYIFSIEV